ncbi:hypothetical protein J4230_04225 [Candidatus Woesearchaeota archaeon]|nr:hypothetical protein [Candidatus Woesearchaeota archaeon]
MSELDKMSFIEDLSDVTGTEEVSGVVRLIDREIVGSSKFINSGVSLKRKLDESILDFDSTSNNIYDYFSFGSRFRPTRLNMPRNYLGGKPHFHPGGELAYVYDGAYFDADMEGNPIRVYLKGSVIFYPRGSTHRHLSRNGAELLYIPFNGTIFGDNAEDLVNKMVRFSTPQEALEYALLWMVPDNDARLRLMDKLGVIIT